MPKSKEFSYEELFKSWSMRSKLKSVSEITGALKMSKQEIREVFPHGGHFK